MPIIKQEPLVSNEPVVFPEIDVTPKKASPDDFIINMVPTARHSDCDSLDANMRIVEPDIDNYDPITGCLTLFKELAYRFSTQGCFQAKGRVFPK